MRCTRWWLGVAAAVCLALAGCAESRPEGPAERYLSAISRDTDAGAIAKFGDIEVAQEVLGFEITGEASENQRHLDRFEVGAALGEGDRKVVPVQIWRHGSSEPEQLALELDRVDGDWHVTGVTEPEVETLFPSEGGSTYGLSTRALVTVALVTLAAAFVLALVVVRLSGARPLHKRPELHGG